MPANLENSAVATGLEKVVFIPIPKKDNAKECSSLVQFSSITQSCLTLCDSMDCSKPGLPIHHQLLEFTETHVHWVDVAIQPSHLLPSPSQHQCHFQRVSSLHQVAKRLEFQLQHQPYQWIFKTDFLRIDWLELLAAQGCSESSPTPQFKSINSSVLSFLYNPTLLLYMTTGKTSFE